MSGTKTMSWTLEAQGRLRFQRYHASRMVHRARAGFGRVPSVATPRARR